MPSAGCIEAALTIVSTLAIEVTPAMTSSIGARGGKSISIRNVYVILISHMMVVPVGIPAMPSPGLAR
jgi:hypothetical protein